MKRYTVKDIEALLPKLGADDPRWEMLRQDERKSVQALLARFERQKARRHAIEQRWEELMRYERELYAAGVRRIAGIDEAGRGPLAGPVVAAAVILPKDAYLPGLDDSKRLTPEKREALFAQIEACAVAIGIGIVSAAEIDERNIYEATRQAMAKAVNALSPPPEHLLVDAMAVPCPLPQQRLIKGDANSASIAAASVIAKVTRDRWMKELDRRYPQYGFARHMGYGTPEHFEAIRRYGVTPEHRRSFAPVREVLKASEQL
ncbi:ribonuclease HII [Geobacillus sp. G4]|uniref:Ribonuclease HII n=6 Tax=Geobacillus TaxID=129337 RepID=RNH2_GEOKA|nr:MULTISPECIES: ribonuclease HII [Geobacillus]Q5L0P0.1 RecName: Full=Ribonuclease HII; Short=RNase HII [Geobacillus kaustophilus HTA426]AMV10436.1 ribonuclease HII [Geobacillus thermoleovorans]AOL34045.1 ribonuclease HII [Geobacillus thermoleovorans]AUI35840.1 ribonuclease HII [[Bacillus] caldolyticus]AWO73319.1 ribonuclease HII [Geobacillus thermoleovorans]EQB96786.1 ribonuclease HII [Geobacillus sp. A8]